MDTLKLEKGSTLMVAHRGLSGIEKENTINIITHKTIKTREIVFPFRKITQTFKER